MPDVTLVYYHINLSARSVTLNSLTVVMNESVLSHYQVLVGLEISAFILMYMTFGLSRFITSSSSSSSSSTGFDNPLAGFSLLIFEVSRSHTRTHHSR